MLHLNTKKAGTKQRPQPREQISLKAQEPKLRQVFEHIDPLPPQLWRGLVTFPW